MNRYRHYFALEKQLKQAGYPLDRADAVSQLTGGRKSSLRELADGEYAALIRMMRQTLASTSHTADNRMRRKVIALFRKMGYEKELKVNSEKLKMVADMPRIYAWVKHYGKFHKPLNDHTTAELAALVSQVELVYQRYLKEVHR